MSDSYEKRDTLPMTWWGRMPVYATTIMVLLDLLGMFATTILRSAHMHDGGTMWVFNTFGFDAEGFWKHWSFWTPFTYPLISFPSFFYIFGLFFLYNFGIGVESYLGRRVYLRIVGLLLLWPVVGSSLLWLFTGMSGPMAGNFEFSIGIFIAYATLYPNVEYWNWMTMKWLAFAGIFLMSLRYLPEHNWMGLAWLLSTCALAHTLVRYERGHWNLPTIRFPSRKPKLRVLPKPSAQPRRIPREELEEGSVDTEVDALLDKIAKSGIGSLTAAERARLEKARQELLKRERE